MYCWNGPNWKLSRPSLIEFEMKEKNPMQDASSNAPSTMETIDVAIPAIANPERDFLFDVIPMINPMIPSRIEIGDRKYVNVKISPRIPSIIEAIAGPLTELFRVATLFFS